MRPVLKMIAISGLLMMIGNGQPAKASLPVKRPPIELPAKLLDMRVSEFVKLSTKDFSTSVWKKLSLKEKISFSLLKKDMRKSLKSHPDQYVKGYMATASKKNNTGVIIIGIVVVLIIIGVIIASSINLNLGLGE
jgi:hypothetical protein